MFGCRLARMLLVAGMVIASVSAPAAAQQDVPPEGRRLGLTVGYPSNSAVIGVVWETPTRVTVRAELTAEGFHASNAYGSGGSYSVGAAVSVLRDVARKENASLYVGPRFTYARRNGSGSTAESTYGAGATLGLRYALTRRISLYGEAGLSYTYTRNASYYAEGTESYHAIGSRSGLGLNLFF
jgi:hypothetical protein